MINSFKMYLVAYVNEYYEGGIATALWNHSPTEGSDVALLREITVDVDEPSVDVIKDAIAGKLEALREYQAAVAKAADVELQGKINSLLALENG
jgi:hypothetical protein